MQEIQLYTGGHPRSNEDLLHMQQGYIEALEGLAKAINIFNPSGVNAGYKLWGCTFVVTGPGVFDITPGAVCVNGKVYLYDGIVGLTATVFQVWFTIVTTYGTGNPVTYADASTKNVHKIEKMKEYVAVSPGLPSDLLYYTLYDLKGMVRTYLDAIYVAAALPVFNVVNTLSMYIAGWADYDVANKLEFTANSVTKEYCFRGWAKKSSGSNIILNIGISNAPTKNHMFEVACKSTAVAAWDRAVVGCNSSGDITVLSVAGATPPSTIEIVDLSQVRYFKV